MPPLRDPVCRHTVALRGVRRHHQTRTRRCPRDPSGQAEQDHRLRTEHVRKHCKSACSPYHEKTASQEPYGCGDQGNSSPCMFQVYDPKRMLVRWAVLDEIRLARCKAMARQRPSNRLRAQLFSPPISSRRQARRGRLLSAEAAATLLVFVMTQLQYRSTAPTRVSSCPIANGRRRSSTWRRSGVRSKFATGRLNGVMDTSCPRQDTQTGGEFWSRRRWRGRSLFTHPNVRRRELE